MDKNNNKIIPTLNIEHGLKNMTIKKMSEYKSNIRYIKLETNENCLVTNMIHNVYIEDDKIFIHDEEPFLKIFDANSGKYLYNIGNKGQGPGELTGLSHVHVQAKEKKVILAWQKFRYVYDFNGNYLYNIDVPLLPTDSTESVSYNIIMLNPDLFAAGVYTYQDHQINAIVIFDKQQNIVNTLKSFDEYNQHATIKTWSPNEQLGFCYSCSDRIHFFRGVCDTIYEYNTALQNFEPYVCFDFGKHRSAHDAYWDNENKDAVTVKALSENEDCLFIDFDTKKASPQPFEEIVLRMGQQIKMINRSVYAVYDKKNDDFCFLLQPIAGIKGLKNDLDGGLPFWPKNISSSNEFIDYMHAEKLLSYSDELSSPSDSFKIFVKEIDEEANPIIIIAY